MSMKHLTNRIPPDMLEDVLKLVMEFEIDYPGYVKHIRGNFPAKRYNGLNEPYSLVTLKECSNYRLRRHRDIATKEAKIYTHLNSFNTIYIEERRKLSIEAFAAALIDSKELYKRGKAKREKARSRVSS